MARERKIRGERKKNPSRGKELSVERERNLNLESKVSSYKNGYLLFFSFIGYHFNIFFCKFALDFIQYIN